MTEQLNHQRHCEELLRRSNPFCSGAGCEMDCFVAPAFARRRASADAPLRKRFAFVAGNDVEGVSIRISNTRYTSAFSRHELPEVCLSLSLEE